MKKGFTLIELIITVILISIVMGSTSIISIQSNVKKNNDLKRITDLEKVRSALELYRSNNPTREYPDVAYSALFSLLSPYLSIMPTDPTGGTYYYNRINPYSYTLCASMELPININSVCNFGGNYGITQP